MYNKALNLTYSEIQEKVFFRSNQRFKIVAKGRRVGFTRGAAQYVIETMLTGDKKVLWGDVTLLNIRNYFERYFRPVLNVLPSDVWQWRVTDKQLYIGSSVCDFRSADNPEGWEGFGYDLIILNEAGIILKNRYLWENAVRPMMIDNENSSAIIGGTPKGKGLFYELWLKGETDKNFESFHFSTYDNPFLTKKAVDEFVMEQSDTNVRQEIYGEFIDNSDNELFHYSDIMRAISAEAAESGGLSLEVWGVDVARQGADQSVLAKRRNNHIYELLPRSTPDLTIFADEIISAFLSVSYKPDAIFVEINGIGGGLFDMLRRAGLPVIDADVSRKSANSKIFNKRSEMYKTFADEMKKGMKIPNDKKLIGELSCISYEIVNESVLKVSKKDEIKKQLGYSPDRADACALTFYAPVVPKALRYQNKNQIKRMNNIGGLEL